MATSKTINPTNVTVQIPAMADKPNQSLNSNCLDKIIDGVNAVNSKLEAEISLPSGYSVSGNNKVYKVGKVAQFSVALTIPAWTTKTLSINGIIPSGFTPNIETNFVGIDNTNDLAINCFISSGGNLSIYRSHTTSCTKLRLGVTYLT